MGLREVMDAPETIQKALFIGFGKAEPVGLWEGRVPPAQHGMSKKFPEEMNEQT